MSVALSLLRTTITIPRIEHESESAFIERVRRIVSEKGCKLTRITGTSLGVSKIQDSHIEFLSSLIEVDLEMEC